MATFNKFNDFAEQLGLKKINLDTDTLKVMLTNTAPIATNTIYSDLVDLSTANGYTAGGADATAAALADAAVAGRLPSEAAAERLRGRLERRAAAAARAPVSLVQEGALGRRRRVLLSVSGSKWVAI
jgi:hypothetical protein